MAKVKFDMSMSMDGFITGPEGDVDVDRLHEWMYGLESWRRPHGHEGGAGGQDAEVMEEAFASVGAFLMGRRMFDAGEGPWGDDPPFHMPVFVLTHEARDPVPKEGGTTFTFVTDGIESALEQARAAAGEKDVAISGGANVVQQYLTARLVDEMHLHVAPVLLGAGIRLFDQLGTDAIELERLSVIDSPTVTHLKFRVAKR